MFAFFKNKRNSEKNSFKFNKSYLFNILNWEKFQEIIKYERIRAARDGSKFSLIVLDLENEFINTTRISKIIYHVKSVIRLTDYIGWFDEYKVGILLPVTERSGAEEFIKKLDSSIPVNDYRIQYHIYLYPDNWFQNLALSPVEKNKTGNRSLNNDDIEQAFVVVTPSWKRFIDIFFSIVFMVIFSPLFLLVSVCIKLVSKGSVFYRSERVGKNCKKFIFYKFRTMHEENNQNFHAQHAREFIKKDKPMTKLDSKGDSRIIPIGRFLRKTCIDELPQLINVLKGEMSLVGPRPCIPYEAEEYLRWHTHRFDILPGITGLWQVSGKNSLTFQEMVRMDILYTKKISFLMDLKILLKTIPVVIGLAIDNPSEEIKGLQSAG